MAMLHGFEILDMHSFEGREGIGTQGTVYLDGDELGFWSNDGDGGMDRFHFPHEKLDQLVAEQCPDVNWTSYDGSSQPGDLGLLLAHLADLEEQEQVWRQADAEGSALMVLTSFPTGEFAMYFIPKGDDDFMAGLASESAPEYAEQCGFSEYTVDIYSAQYQFEQGTRLRGTEEALEDIMAYKERVAKYR